MSGRQQSGQELLRRVTRRLAPLMRHRGRLMPKRPSWAAWHVRSAGSREVAASWAGWPSSPGPCKHLAPNFKVSCFCIAGLGMQTGNTHRLHMQLLQTIAKTSWHRMVTCAKIRACSGQATFQPSSIRNIGP